MAELSFDIAIGAPQLSIEVGELNPGIDLTVSLADRIAIALGSKFNPVPLEAKISAAETAARAVKSETEFPTLAQEAKEQLEKVISEVNELHKEALTIAKHMTPEVRDDFLGKMNESYKDVINNALTKVNEILSVTYGALLAEGLITTPDSGFDDLNDGLGPSADALGRPGNIDHSRAPNDLTGPQSDPVQGYTVTSPTGYSSRGINAEEGPGSGGLNEGRYGYNDDDVYADLDPTPSPTPSPTAPNVDPTPSITVGEVTVNPGANTPPEDDPDVEGPFPIILDLDGNGIQITDLSQSTTFVDGGDGLEHRTAWAGAGDGVLFYDPEGTGEITEMRQYVFTEWDPTASSDMEALAAVFDTNGDGELSGAELDDFRIMVTNADGTTTSYALFA